MSYYVEPDYWVSGYAEGDAQSGAASILPSLSVSGSASRKRAVAFVDALAASMSANADRRRHAAILAQAQLSTTKSVERIRLAAASVSGSLVGSILAKTIVNVKSTQTILSLASSFAGAIRNTSLQVPVYATMQPSARYKWEADAVTPETWTASSPSDGTWVEISATIIDWSNIAASSKSWSVSPTTDETWTEQ